MPSKAKTILTTTTILISAGFLFALTRPAASDPKEAPSPTTDSTTYRVEIEMGGLITWTPLLDSNGRELKETFALFANGKISDPAHHPRILYDCIDFEYEDTCSRKYFEHADIVIDELAKDTKSLVRDSSYNLIAPLAVNGSGYGAVAESFLGEPPTKNKDPDFYSNLIGRMRLQTGVLEADDSCDFAWTFKKNGTANCNNVFPNCKTNLEEFVRYSATIPADRIKDDRLHIRLTPFDGGQAEVIAVQFTGLSQKTARLQIRNEPYERHWKEKKMGMRRDLSHFTLHYQLAKKGTPQPAAIPWSPKPFDEIKGLCSDRVPGLGGGGPIICTTARAEPATLPSLQSE